MPYFHKSDNFSGRFWSISRQDCELSISHGVLKNGDIRHSTKSFANAEKARLDAEKQIRKKREEGYIQVHAGDMPDGAIDWSSELRQQRVPARPFHVPEPQQGLADFMPPEVSRHYDLQPNGILVDSGSKYLLDCEGIQRELDALRVRHQYITPANLSPGQEQVDRWRERLSGMTSRNTQNETVISDGTFETILLEVVRVMRHCLGDLETFRCVIDRMMVEKCRSRSDLWKEYKRLRLQLRGMVSSFPEPDYVMAKAHLTPLFGSHDLDTDAAICFLFPEESIFIEPVMTRLRKYNSPPAVDRKMQYSESDTPTYQKRGSASMLAYCQLSLEDCEWLVLTARPVLRHALVTYWLWLYGAAASRLLSLCCQYECEMGYRIIDASKSAYNTHIKPSIQAVLTELFLIRTEDSVRFVMACTYDPIVRDAMFALGSRYPQLVARLLDETLSTGGNEYRQLLRERVDWISDRCLASI